MHVTRRWLTFAILAMVWLVAMPAAAQASPPVVDATVSAAGNTAPSGWYNVPVAIEFRGITWDDPVTDGGYDIAALHYSVNGGVAVAAESTSCLRASADGRYLIEAQGTWGGFAYPLEFGIDRTPPTSSSDAKSVYVGSAPISITASDALSGVARIRYSLDGAPEVGESVSRTASCVTIRVGPGEHRLVWVGVDRAGNEEPARHSASFSVLGLRQWGSGPGLHESAFSAGTW